ncbi:MAG: T6SS phospholipase effector Tle1-like catalytic domain-containing protein [Bacteroidales bacterium]
MSAFVYNENIDDTPVNANSADLITAFGIFFDGTLNNMYNTDIIIKINKEINNRIEESKKRQEKLKKYIKNPFPDPTIPKDASSIFREINKLENISREEVIDDYAAELNLNRSGNEEAIAELEAYKKNVGENSSYDNAYSNVARQWSCLNVDQCIYVEGMGTKEMVPDDPFGKGFGSGKYGIKERMKEACGFLAKKISDYVEQEEIDITKANRLYIKLDVFGFSRGAATARHFLHEIQKKKNMGHLGESLSKLDLPKEYIKVNVRFLGLYDTVSSYHEGLKIRNSEIIKRFSNDVEELQLNNLGSIQKAVHLTAQDEHREYFALTRLKSPMIKTLIERSMPGVHSDIGGSYRSEGEEVEIENNEYFSYERMKILRTRLIEEGWFKEDEIYFNDDKSKLLSNREYISNEYSYIPLHFMSEHADEHIKDYKLSELDVKTKYKLPDDPILELAKKRLEGYVMHHEKESNVKLNTKDTASKKYQAEMKFNQWNDWFQDRVQSQTNACISTEQKVKNEKLRQQKQQERSIRIERLREEAEAESKENEERRKEYNDALEKERKERAIEKNERIMNKRLQNKFYSEDKWEYDSSPPEEKEACIGEQELLKNLRGKYLHWSANRKGMGVDPTNNRKRTEY